MSEHIGGREELIPIATVSSFFYRHEAHAKLTLQYPAATVYRNTVSWTMIDQYRKTFRGEDLPRTAFACIGRSHKQAHERSIKVASEYRYIVLPMASADANLVAAYANLKCQEIFESQSWLGSILSTAQHPSLDIWGYQGYSPQSAPALSRIFM